MGSELSSLLGSGPLSQIETFVTFCGMVGLQAMVLGRLGCRPHPRASALSCPSPFAGRGSHTSQGTGLRPLYCPWPRFFVRFSRQNLVRPARCPVVCCAGPRVMRPYLSPVGRAQPDCDISTVLSQGARHTGF